MKRILETLGSGVVVYAIVAACSGGADHVAGSDGGATAPDSGSAASGGVGGDTGVSGSGGSSVGQGGGLLDAMADAIVNPVPDAMAQDGAGGAGPVAPAPPVVVERDCDIPAWSRHFAELEIDGTVEELAQVLTLIDLGTDQGYPAGYQIVRGGMALKPGAIVVQCPLDSAAKFIIPAHLADRVR
jgi:hypothetical protein